MPASSAAAIAIACGMASRIATSRRAGPWPSRSSRVRASSPRIRTASGARAYAMAAPGRPAARRASRAASGGSATPCSPRIASMSRTPTGPSRRRAQRERTVGSSLSSSSAHRIEGETGRRLLEGLEERRLGILVHAVGGLDDRDASRPFEGHEDELADQLADASDLRTRAADDDLALPAPPGRAGGGPDGRHARAGGTRGTTGRAVPRRPGRRRATRPRGPSRASSCRRRPAR